MNIVEYLTEKIKALKPRTPLLIAIDGIDAAGKTILADKLAENLSAQSFGTPIRISIDKFHNPRSIRMRKGDLSPEGYYYDSFDYAQIISCVLDPVRNNAGYLIPGAYDYRTESPLSPEPIPVTNDLVVLFDGIFLLREELRRYWDLAVFLDISFETMLERALKRDAAYLGSTEEVRRRYEQRYIPGEKIYLEKCRPRQTADIVIDNNDFSDPKLIKSGSAESND